MEILFYWSLRLALSCLHKARLSEAVPKTQLWSSHNHLPSVLWYQQMLFKSSPPPSFLFIIWLVFFTWGLWNDGVLLKRSSLGWWVTAKCVTRGTVQKTGEIQLKRGTVENTDHSFKIFKVSIRKMVHLFHLILESTGSGWLDILLFMTKLLKKGSTFAVPI